MCLGKFTELAPILISTGASLKGKGKVYSACVQCVMTYGRETWPMRVEDISVRHLERAEKMMIRRFCGVSLCNGKTREEIRNRLGIVSVSDLVRQWEITMVWAYRA